MPDPFSDKPGARLYKTGDLCRRREDGVLEYLGRLEQALVTHADVHACMVLAHADTAGDRQLVAFVVPRAGARLRGEELPAFLRQRLPRFMLPARFIVLDALPLTPNGKVDRAALRAMADERHTADGARQPAPPRTPTEHAVLATFAELFPQAKPELSDSFFDLGGHSLMALRLVAALRTSAGVELSLRDLYEQPTAAGLAGLIDGRATTPADAGAIVPLQGRGTRMPIFAVGGHNGDVFCYRHLARHLGDEQPFFGLQPPGVEGGGEPLTRIEDLAAYFAERVRAVAAEGPYVVAGYCAGGCVAFELARQLRAGGGTVACVALFGCPHPSFFRLPRQWATRAATQLRRLAMHARALVARSPRQWGDYLRTKLRGRQARLAGERADLPDAALAARAKVEQATLAAVRRYRPRRFDGRVALLLPSKAWRSGGFAARRWHALARHSDEYCGPDGCGHDDMLREPHAAVFAELLKRCCERVPS